MSPNTVQHSPTHEEKDVVEEDDFGQEIVSVEQLVNENFEDLVSIHISDVPFTSKVEDKCVETPSKVEDKDVETPSKGGDKDVKAQQVETPSTVEYKDVETPSKVDDKNVETPSKGGDKDVEAQQVETPSTCLLYTSPSPRDGLLSRMPSSA